MAKLEKYEWTDIQGIYHCDKICSDCGETIIEFFPRFCPFCGEKLDGKQKFLMKDGAEE